VHEWKEVSFLQQWHHLVFYGDNYQMWVVHMETYLEALDLCEVVEEYYEIQSLLEIMSLKSAKAIWDYLKAEYEGDERIRGMQVLNLNLRCFFEDNHSLIKDAT